MANQQNIASLAKIRELESHLETFKQNYTKLHKKWNKFVENGGIHEHNSVEFQSLIGDSDDQKYDSEIIKKIHELETQFAERDSIISEKEAIILKFESNLSIENDVSFSVSLNN